MKHCRWAHRHPATWPFLFLRADPFWRRCTRRLRVTTNRRTIATRSIFVIRGRGVFFDGQARHRVETGAFLFVAAGQPHRFEEFTDDFAAWVLFYGPPGGEVS